MRDIKFRAYSKSYKKMFDNEILERVADVMYEVGKSLLLATREHEAANDLQRGIYLPTKDEDLILMQYTGLKDKNGVEIYEGDIIKGISKTHKNNKITLYVKWDRGQYDVFDIHDKDNWMDSLYNHMHFYDIEVIGNIYENPELLEGIPYEH